MSILGTLDTVKFTNLPDILSDYDKRLKDWKIHVNIDGKNIESANVEQASRLAYYDEVRSELHTLKEFFDMKVKEIRGKVLTYIIKSSRQDHTDRVKEQLINCDPDYLRINNYYIEIEDLYVLADSIVRQFRERAFTIKNAIEIRKFALQDQSLYIDER